MSVANIQTAANAATSSGSEPPTYTVRSGDTLSGIAAAHGVSVQALEAANPQILHPDLIRAGQVVHIPAAGAHAAPSTPSTYQVRSGDTLSAIGQRFGVDWRILAQTNGVTNPNRLQVGTELKLHPGAATPAPQRAPNPGGAAAPVSGTGGAARTAGAGLPNTDGMSQTQKVQLYSNYINTYGDAQAKADLAAGRQVILGLRHETSTHANGGGGVYDDRIAVVSRTGVQEFRGNTEPSSRYEGRYGSDANGDGRRDLGQLAEGNSRYTRSSSGHLGDVLRPTGGVAIERDVNHDGHITAGEGRGTSTDQSFLFHAGGNTITGSAGCQTMAPGDFGRFWSHLSSGQQQFSYVLVDADRHGVGAAAAPPSTPAPAANSGSNDNFQPGGLSARYESNGNPGTVSSGAGDAGGVSYGAYQMTATNAANFVAHEGARWPELQGHTPGTPAFSAAWRAVAARDPQAFLAAQHDNIARTHYQPQVAAVQDATGVNIDAHSHALRDVAWSTADQHGAATGIVTGAIRQVEAQGVHPDDARFDAAVINAVYAERGRTGPNGELVHFSSSSASVQQGVAARFVSERSRALNELAAERR